MDFLINYANDKIKTIKGIEYNPDIRELQKYIDDHLLNQFSFYDMKMCFMAGWRAGLNDDPYDNKIKNMNDYIEFVLDQKSKHEK